MFDIGTKIIWFSLIKVSYSYEKISQIQTIHSRTHIDKTFDYLKAMDGFRNFATFFTLVIEKMGLYANIANENIGYSKLSQDARYRKLVENT